MSTLLLVKNLMFVIHTRDHGWPHVTVYRGNPESHEAMAKIRLDVLEAIEVNHFSKRDMAVIIKITAQYQTEWLEAWNEIFKGR